MDDREKCLAPGGNWLSSAAALRNSAIYYEDVKVELSPRYGPRGLRLTVFESECRSSWKLCGFPTDPCSVDLLPHSAYFQLVVRNSSGSRNGRAVHVVEGV